jgi:vacuolar-type H+-ATPase subunit B/Vma2
MTYSELNSLSIEQLRSLNSKVVEVIKMKRSEVALDVKEALYIGANVSVKHPKLAGKQCRVEKINRTKAVLKVLNGTSYGSVGSYTVPLSMISLNK